MITPLKVVIAALVLGIGGAVLFSMRTPPAPTEAVAPPPPTVTESPEGPAAPTAKPALALVAGARTVTPSGLTIIEVKTGTGVAAKSGDAVTVHYIGRLYNGGDQFDNSYDRGTPLPFTIGAGQLIKGFDEGVIGMKVGGKRELLIPPELGYGDRGAGDKIPGGATLVFDVEMMTIQQ
jgi:peptidylprolyl isomerase